MQKPSCNKHMSCDVRKPVFMVSDQVQHKSAFQSRKKARRLTLWTEVNEELYYPSSENKGADQLCIGKNPVFL